MSKGSKTAFISGSGRNIGRGCAIRLAEDGFNVVVNGSADRAACEAVAAEVRKHGVKASVAMGDVGERDEVLRMADDALKEFGSVDVLINNAAIRPHAGFLEMDENEWYRVFDVNCHAAFWFARAFLPGMVKNGWGRIVNFAGRHAIQGTAQRAPVSASKHAAWGLTKTLAREFGPKGVTANLISPGTILGEIASTAENSVAVRAKPEIPVGRVGVPEDIATMVSLLASDKGSFINGQMLQINGGVVG